MLLEKIIQVSKTPKTTGAFFLNDKIPDETNKKTMKGIRNPKHSLNIRLMV